MLTPRVAAIHDMSGFGRCSLTVAIPILSAMGIQCCPLPTAFLSTHTGGFEGFTFLDMTDEMPRVAAHWKSLNLEFQAIYSGFLGSERQIAIVADHRQFRGTFRRRGDTLVVIDPVMGDFGKVYQTYTAGHVRRHRPPGGAGGRHHPQSDGGGAVAGLPLRCPARRRAGCREIVERLSLEGRRSVVLTGASGNRAPPAPCALTPPPAGPAPC